jgi:hypothetical protein
MYPGGGAQGRRALELADRTPLPAGPIEQGWHENVSDDDFSSST